MKNRIIIEDRSVIPEVEQYMNERLKEFKFCEFFLDDNADDSLDKKLHDFILKSIIPQKPGCIILPCSLGEYHTDYLGIRLGLHFRLTRQINEFKYIPLVFYSPDDLQDIIRFIPMAGFIGTLGNYLVKDNINDIKKICDLELCNLNDIDYEKFLSTLHFDPPGNYYSEHSIANEWGAYRLDKIARTEILKQKDFPGMYSLYFKWLDAKSSGVLEIDDNDATSKNVFFTSKPVLPGLKAANISDELKERLRKNIEIDSKKLYRK